MSAITQLLDEFLNNDDPNAWWRLEGGDQLNLFYEAVDRMQAAEAERDAYKRAKAENDERFQIEAAEQRDRADYWYQRGKEAEERADRLNSYLNIQGAKIAELNKVLMEEE